MRVGVEVFEVVDHGTVTQYPSLDEARAARGGGQVRTRTEYSDVPAEYAVTLDGVELGRFTAPAAAATLSRGHRGSRVVMVAAAG